MSKLITAELGLNVHETFWTDSQVVLGYLKNTTKKFHVYVTNRIQQVIDNCSPQSWFYVPTTSNPADHASRGLTIESLLKPQSSWFTGPEFLQHEPIRLPKQLIPQVKADDPEVKALASATSQKEPSLAKRLERLSSWKKAVKVTQLFLEKIYRHKKKYVTNSAKHTNAIDEILKSVQCDHFSEMETLRRGGQIDKNSKLFNLNPFVDDNGVMRVGGRLQNSTSLEYKAKHPVILPRQSHITTILIRQLHEQVAHQGRGITLAKIRSSGYWIIGARSLIDSIIFKCITCRKARAQPSVPLMAPLPQKRASQSPPFTYCGVDCFGPFYVKDRRTELKRYGLIVTCLASRAVHIEVLDDMTSSAFINAIRNVISLRGPIREIRCDQGTNFIGAAPELTEQGVLEFKFNPPHASHMGGVWERMIRTARNVLSVLLKKQGGRIDTSGLRTLMYEVAAIINSRPLTMVDDEQNPLTPNMLLTMKTDIILSPPGEFEEADIYARKRWRTVQQLANHFWQRWKTEYIQTLQSRQKWVKNKPNLKLGSIVLIKNESNTRNEWPLARVVECIVSSDQQVRSAKLLLGNRRSPTRSDQYLIRPVSKLVTLFESE